MKKAVPDRKKNADPQSPWKRRPSEIRGYQRTLYLTAENDDYVRVDYNLKEKKVRLYVEVSSEGGSPYYSVIKEGKITAERNVLTGRTRGFSGKFIEKAALFSTIPNREVLKLINGQYGIAAALNSRTNQESTDRTKRLKETRRRYFVGEKNPYERSAPGAGSASGGLGFKDLFDFLLGIVLSLGLFFFMGYSFLAMGVTASFYGIAVGIVDLFILERPTSILKVVFFVAAGAISYIYGYFIM